MGSETTMWSHHVLEARPRVEPDENMLTEKSGICRNPHKSDIISFFVQVPTSLLCVLERPGFRQVDERCFQLSSTPHQTIPGPETWDMPCIPPCLVLSLCLSTCLHFCPLYHPERTSYEHDEKLVGTFQHTIDYHGFLYHHHPSATNAVKASCGHPPKTSCSSSGTCTPDERQATHLRFLVGAEFEESYRALPRSFFAGISCSRPGLGPCPNGLAEGFTL